ncbi:hypothetical protein ASF49_22685 [Methylobacterium sp. Leaf104]|nr:hypothetical protein ASF49_22685 [Methylobacterium sp. Leaf104]
MNSAPAMLWRAAQTRLMLFAKFQLTCIFYSKIDRFCQMKIQVNTKAFFSASFSKFVQVT